MKNAVILDTETTGLDETAEIIEIGLIDAITGQVLLDTLIKPSIAIPADATAIHKITDKEVEEAPSWPQIYEFFFEIIRGRKVYIYNAAYDLRLIQQTAAKYQLSVQKINSHCVMLDYAKLWQEPGRNGRGWRWQKLSNAMQQQGISVSHLNAHRAVADCEMTRLLLQKIQTRSIVSKP